MSKIKITPLHDRVLILPHEAESKTASGIIIPDQAKEKPMKGEVIACGKGQPNEPMTVKVGNNVLYNKRAGEVIEQDGKKYLLMRETDILAII